MNNLLSHKIEPAAILSVAYFPPVQYISKILIHKKIIIDIFENYQKQSYRNRFRIYSTNGIQDLSIPVQKYANNTPVKEIVIDYDTNWQHLHWNAIISAYGHSPFFEIFEDEFRPLFDQKVKYLVDFNLKTLEQISNSLGYKFAIDISEELIPYSNYLYDFRNCIHPKQRMNTPDPNFKPVDYFQVFKHKSGFLSNLSFIDLMFNEGPQSISICRNSCKFFLDKRQSSV